MGNTLTAPSFVSTQQDLPTLLLDIPAYSHHAVLGGGKIFQTLQTLHEDGYVVIKMYVRRSSDFDLKRYEAKLEELNARLPLSQTPSLLQLVKIEITDRAVYLGRQYLGHNLVDRFHAHPSLHAIEKPWFAYQMLHAVHQLHSRGVRHGDIKTSNFLLTSWNWLFLVDIAFYKPTFLPSDNPADYHFYFSNQGTMGSNGMITQTARRRCYLAPERFYTAITDRKFLEPSVSGGSGGSDGQVSEAMDIFSLGCVIAELFLDGEQVLFDLPLLLAYREGEYDPTPVINKIPHAPVRELIQHMIQRDPTKRLSARQYIKMWSAAASASPATAATPSPSPAPAATGAFSPSQSSPLAPTTAPSPASAPLFPTYFAYLYRFFAKLLTPDLADPDIKVQALKTHRDTIIREVMGREYMEQLARAQAEVADGDAAAAAVQFATPSKIVERTSSAFVTPAAPQGKSLLEELAQFGAALTARTAAGLRPLEEIQAQADAMRGDARTPTPTVTSLPLPSTSPLLSPAAAPSPASLLDLASASNPTSTSTPVLGAATPSELNALALDPSALAPSSTMLANHGTGLTMITSVVCSCLQNVRYPITKLTALELLADFGAFVDDEVRLGRLVPYAVALLTDGNSMVRATACHVLTKLVSMVRSIHSPSDAHLFDVYIFPSLSRFPLDSEEIVRLAYARNIAELATSSKRFLDLAQHERQVAAKQAADQPVSEPAPAASADSADGGVAAAPIEPFDGSYSTDLGTLQDTVLKLVIDMLTLGGPRPKRALLADITKLCVFMGRTRVNNDLLPHLITVLNDRRDWQLRSAFFEYIVGVSVFVGRVAFQNFVLPCIEQALFDVELFVIQRAVHALTALTHLGLFEKRLMLDVGTKAGPLLCHPSAWIRAETVRFFASMSTALGPAKSLVFLAPVMRPFLAVRPDELPDFDAESLHQHLKPNLTQDEFTRAVLVLNAAQKESARANNAPSPAFTGKTMAASPLGESYLGSSRLLESTGGGGVSWTDQGSPLRSAPAVRPGVLASSGSRPSLVPEEESSPPLEDSIESVAAPVGSGYKDDPALLAVMDVYLKRVSSSIQSRSLQSPSSSASVVGGASSLDHASKLSAIDDDSLVIELSHLSLSQTLEEQLPLHQLDIEPTVPEMGSPESIASASALDRAAQETFDSIGVTADAKRIVRSTPATDPSLIPAASNRPGLASPAGAGLTAGATAQGGHPIALRESISLVPEYIRKALNVPLPPPSLGTLRPEWTSHSSFYQNHRVLSTSGESLAMAEAYDPKVWRPKGVLVSTLTEHRHVRTLAVARDNLFLVSGGDEGVVKIWDSQRLKLTAHARSQLSYVQHGRITSLAVCDSSHSVASASSNGSLHVFKVECAANEEGSSSSAARYIGLSDVKRVDPDPVHGEGAILKVAHFNTLTESMLLYGTQKSVRGWDLRSKRDALDLKLEPSMGLLTTMDIGPSPYVCITGTSRGFITVWDMRFQIPVHVWRHSAKTAITQLTAVDAPSIMPKEATPAQQAPHQYPHPTQGPLFFAAAEGTNQIGGFDIYTGESRMLLRVTGGGNGNSAVSGPVPGGLPRMGSFSGASNAPAPTSTSSGLNRTRQKVRVSPLSLPSLRSYIRNEYATAAGGSQVSAPSPYHPSFSASSGFYHSLMGVTLDDSFLREFQTMGAPESANGGPAAANAASINALLVCKDSFALTAGSDKKMRFWDMKNPTDSYRISSSDLADGDYLRYSSRLENSTLVVEEVLSNQHAPGSGGAGAGGSSDDQLRAKLAAARKNSGQMPPSTAHSSEILDMKAIEYPQKMLATASRDGVIKIWI